ncbi:MAG: alpha/beta hydrolase [Fibrobacter sp.]|uniref:alpha/beta hydrolase n=1 Tax=Fibrobacter sp. TaxID=35828 RepID=UPI00388E2D5B|nr:alpha/beta hydrolase [Fibrobacter sp.]
MSEKWIWLPDWASDLALWEDDLTDVEPSADHVFVPFSTMVEKSSDAYKIPGMSSAKTVVGWGMGALVLLKNVAKRPVGQKWILLSPFADFCDDESVWNEQNLVFMSRQIRTTVAPGVKAFAEQIAEDFGDWQDDWEKAALKMNPQVLSDGINYLVQNKVDSVVENSDDIQVVYGRMDQAVPPAQTLKLKDYLPKASFKERPKAGHWPPMLLL